METKFRNFVNKNMKTITIQNRIKQYKGIKRNNHKIELLILLQNHPILIHLIKNFKKRLKFLINQKKIFLKLNH